MSRVVGMICSFFTITIRDSERGRQSTPPIGGRPTRYQAADYSHLGDFHFLPFHAAHDRAN